MEIMSGNVLMPPSASLTCGFVIRAIKGTVVTGQMRERFVRYAQKASCGNVLILHDVSLTYGFVMHLMIVMMGLMSGLRPVRLGTVLKVMAGVLMVYNTCLTCGYVMGKLIVMMDQMRERNVQTALKPTLGNVLMIHSASLTHGYVMDLATVKMNQMSGWRPVRTGTAQQVSGNVLIIPCVSLTCHCAM